MLETWSEGKAPPYGVQASPTSRGRRPFRHRLGQLWRQGRRLAAHSLLNAHGIRGTFCVNARCAEIFPEAVAAIASQGHDVAGHGYLQDQLMTHLDRRRSRPRSAAPRYPRTSHRPAPAGLDQPGDGVHRPYARIPRRGKAPLARRRPRSDLPSVVETEAGPIVQIPGSDFTDNRTLRGNPYDLPGSTRRLRLFCADASRRPSWRCRCTATSAGGR